MGDDQQHCGTIESWYGQRSRSNGCVCVLTEILDLVFNKCLCIQNFNRCIDTLLKKSVMWKFLGIGVFKDEKMKSLRKRAAFVPDSEAFNSFIGDGFLVPELTGGSDASDDVQADNVSNEGLCVIGLYGSGDKICLFF